MKKLFTFLSAFVLITQSFAQASKYKPFPEAYGNWWLRTTHYSMGSSGPYPSGSDDQLFFTAGDSVSNGSTYKLVNRIFVGPVTGPIPSFNYFYTGGTHAFAYRNDSLNRKVYRVAAGNTTETLWYDFNLNKGDTVKGSCTYPVTPNNCFVIVTSIDSILICNQYHKRYNSIPNNGFRTSLVEGIGFTDDFIVTDINTCTFEPPYTAITEAWSPGTACQAPLGLKYEGIAEDGIRLSPNPANAILFIEMPLRSENALISIADISGRIVANETMASFTSRTQLNTTDLANGIYFLSFKTGSYKCTKRVIVQH
jgi:hypothetical protein